MKQKPEPRKRPDDKAVLTIYVDKSLRQRLKVACARKGISMSQLVIKLVEGFLG